MHFGVVTVIPTGRRYDERYAQHRQRHEDAAAYKGQNGHKACLLFYL
jgi:hypothetical protein